jgi:hypothetical protein
MENSRVTTTGAVVLCAFVLVSCGRWSEPPSGRQRVQSVPSGPVRASGPDWRHREERACLASGRVAETAYVTNGRSALGGPTSCGALRPFRVTGAVGGRIGLVPGAVLQCPMIPAMDSWVRSVVEPAARRHLGQTVVRMKVAASYACRTRNGLVGAPMSEHSYANALDISAFELADGRVVTVKNGWRGTSGEQDFLRAVHRGACHRFNTVLGPDADRYHHDHFHFDLARHGRDGRFRVCR